MTTRNPDDSTQPAPEPALTVGKNLDLDLDDPSVVAVFRLPVDLADLMALGNLLERVYGPNLSTRSMVTSTETQTPGTHRYFVITRPDTTSTTAEKDTPDA
jgi:hypothetical protein